MSENFGKIKQKYLVSAIVTGVVIGVCCGIFAACTLLLAFKLTATDFFWAYYIPIALGVALICGGVTFLALRPNDKKMAKRLDKELQLNEKVQTMVEYSGEGGTIPKLQREQADSALAAKAAKGVDLSLLLKLTAIPVLALAMLFVGVFVPAKKGTGTEPPVYTVTQEEKLQALIKEVESSELGDSLKLSTTTTLNALLDGLKENPQQSVVKEQVKSSVKSIDTAVAESNSYLKFHYAFKDEAELATLAIAIVDGVTYYKNGGKIQSFAAVTAKAEDAGEKISAVTDAWVKAFMERFVTDAAVQDNTPLPVSEAAPKAGLFYSALAGVLSDEDLGVPQEDLLFISLVGFTDGLSTIDTAGMGATTYYNKISAVSNAFSASCTDALSVQSYSCMMDEYIRYKLAEIFGIDVAEFGSNQDVVPDTGSSSEELGVRPGGYGEGEINFGSDDLVLDVDTGEYVPYGPLLNDKYGPMIEERLAEIGTTGDAEYDKFVRDELSKYVRQYLRILYGGVREESGN